MLKKKKIIQKVKKNSIEFFFVIKKLDKFIILLDESEDEKIITKKTFNRSI